MFLILLLIKIFIQYKVLQMNFSYSIYAVVKHFTTLIINNEYDIFILWILKKNKKHIVPSECFFVKNGPT